MSITTCIHKKSASSLVEYLSLVIIIIGAIVVIKPYVTRAFVGNWKKSGDSFAFGRRYNTNTIDCDYSATSDNSGIWYDATCYQQSVQACDPGDYTCEDQVKQGCETAFCKNH